MGNRSKTSVTRIKEVQALEMRANGAMLAEIAAELGYANESGAYKAITRALDRVLYAAADEERRIEVVRREREYANLVPLFSDPNKGPRAIEVAQKVAERKAKLLGLDMPEAATPPVDVIVTFRNVSADDI